MIVNRLKYYRARIDVAGMVSKIVLTIFFVSIFAVQGAHGQSVTGKDFNRRAYEHFRNGLLYDIQGNTDEAIKEMIRAVQLDSSNSVILKSLGDLYIFKAQDYHMGAAVYERYLAKNPFHDRTIEVVTQIYLQSRPPRLERLENVLSMVISRGNDQPKFYVTLVDVLLKQKKVNFAQNMAVMLINRTRQLQESCEKIAEMFINNSMVVEGVDFFKDYLQDNPDSPNIGIILGVLYQALNDQAAAEQAYLTVLRNNESAFRARFRLSEMYVEAEKVDNALQLYDIPDFDDPMEIPVKLSISELLLQQFPDIPFSKIESIMNTVVHKAGSNALIYYYLGRAQSGLSRNDDAVENFRKSLYEDPLNEIVLFYLTQAEMERENFREASTAIAKALELRPDEKAFYVIQGLVFDRLGEYNSAIATYEAGIAVNSSNESAQATLLNNYSYILSQHDGDLNKALEMAKKAIAVEPDNSSFLDTIGWVYYKLEDYAKALDYIQRSVDSNPESSEVLDHLGDVFEKLGDLVKAQEYWNKALELDSENFEIQEKLSNARNQ